MQSFGNRRLEEDDDVFNENAWDQYEWTEEMEREAQNMIDLASQEPLPAEKREHFLKNAANFWDEFYDHHESHFFKNRKWLTREFPELLDRSLASGPFRPSEHVDFPGQSSSFRVLEVGCGAGNTVTPILEAKERGVEDTFIYACDFSEKAVALVRSSYLYRPEHCLAFEQDISKPNLTWPFPPGSIDVICMIFVLSAISPADFSQTICNLRDCLRPGGMILFRDYGRFDMAQLRFKKGRCISENFYTRGDGTCVYFFQQEEVRRLFTEAGLVEVENHMDRRLLVNRRRKLKMYRVWLQCRYQKPIE
uniref:tRNA N(3)-methylcytidine methyltransferase n=1 Tax=Schistocephalus solidus TaxID=70667 RepID=A0A0X3NMY4_SCHSO